MKLNNSEAAPLSFGKSAGLSHTLRLPVKHTYVNPVWRVLGLKNHLVYPNQIRTSKYTPFTFFPRCGVEQFDSLSNVYFLVIIALIYLGEYTNLYESPYSGLGTLLALTVVIGFTMTFEAIYDFKRHIEDNKVNKKRCERVRPSDGSVEVVPWEAVAPGDVIRVADREQVPADMVFLCAQTGSTNHGLNSCSKCYIETANIDGETNLKIKHIPKQLYEIVKKKSESWNGLFSSLEGVLCFEQPSSSLEFSGVLHLGAQRPTVEKQDADTSYEMKSGGTNISLNFSHLLLRGSVLRNTTSILGLVVYAGNHTKAVQAAKKVTLKLSKVQRSVNRIVLYLIYVGLGLCIVSSLLKTYVYLPDSQFWYLHSEEVDTFSDAVSWSEYSLPPLMASFITFIILYSGLVPISLLVILAFANFFQALQLQWDDELADKAEHFRSKCNTMELMQEIGQVSYLFSDKTGTLTKNEMKLVGISVTGKVYGFEDVGLSESTGSNESAEKGLSFGEDKLRSDVKQVWEKVAFVDQADRRASSEEKSCLKEFLTMMSLCHTVLVEDKDIGLEYIAEGPDEEALVKGAARLGVRLTSTDNGRYELSLREGVREVEQAYEIVAVNQFTSSRKRMSCLLKTVISGRVQYLLFCKGADNVMFERSMDAEAQTSSIGEGDDDRKGSSSLLQSHLELFSEEGLRTLVYGVKALEETNAKSWLNTYYSAQKVVGPARSEALEAAAEVVETNLRIVGATAIEDKLQENVQATLDSLKTAGIRCWVLTGDKVATAINIGFSCGLLSTDMELVKLTSNERENNMQVLSDLEKLLTPQNLKNGSTLRKKGKRLLRQLNRLNRLTIDSLYGAPSSFFKFRTKSMETQSNVADGTYPTRGRPSMSVSISTVATGADLESGAEQDSDSCSMLEEDRRRIEQHNFQAENMALVVTGTSLAGLLKDQTGTELSQSLLFKIAKVCSVVIACRLSPKQKALLVKMVHDGHSGKDRNPASVQWTKAVDFNVCQYLWSRVSLQRIISSCCGCVLGSPGSEIISLAIGDGSNDIPMLQEANIGVGICGKEGQQAANSADFKINQFQFLRPLLLKHGRYNYLRTATLILFVFYSQILLVLTFVVYNTYNKFSGSTVFFVYLLTFYTYPTNIGIMVVCAYNCDVSQETLLKYPALYTSGRLNHHLSTARVLKYILLALTHAAVICWVQMVLAPKTISRHTLSSSLYLSCVLVTTARCCLETYSWTPMSFLSITFCVASFLVMEPLYYTYDDNIQTTYGGSALWFGLDADAEYIWLSNILGVSVCVLLDLMVIYIRKEFYPTMEDIAVEIDRGYGGQGNRERKFTILSQIVQRFTQPLKLPKTAIKELLTALQNGNVKPAGSTRNFAFDNPHDEQASDTVAKSSVNRKAKQKTLIRIPSFLLKKSQQGEVELS